MENNTDNNEGFHKRKAQYNFWFQIFDGSICLKTKAKNQNEREDLLAKGWEEVMTVNPRTKEEVYTLVDRYDELVVRIIRIVPYKKDFTESGGGKESGLNFHIQAGRRKAILQLKWLEGVLKRLMKVAPNVNWDRPLEISVWPDSKRKACVSFKQGGEKVEEYWYSTRDGGNIPAPVQDEMDGKWDFREQDKFLWKDFNERVIKPLEEKYQAQITEFEEEEHRLDHAIEHDDAPFEDAAEVHITNEPVPTDAKPVNRPSAQSQHTTRQDGNGSNRAQQPTVKTTAAAPVRQEAGTFRKSLEGAKPESAAQDFEGPDPGEDEDIPF